MTKNILHIIQSCTSWSLEGQTFLLQIKLKNDVNYFNAIAYMERSKVDENLESLIAAKLSLILAQYQDMINSKRRGQSNVCFSSVLSS